MMLRERARRFVPTSRTVRFFRWRDQGPELKRRLTQPSRQRRSQKSRRYRRNFNGIDTFNNHPPMGFARRADCWNSYGRQCHGDSFIHCSHFKWRFRHYLLHRHFKSRGIYKRKQYFTYYCNRLDQRHPLHFHRNRNKYNWNRTGIIGYKSGGNTGHSARSANGTFGIGWTGSSDFDLERAGI